MVLIKLCFRSLEEKRRRKKRIFEENRKMDHVDRKETAGVIETIAIKSLHTTDSLVLY